MLEHNKKMQEFLKENGINAIPKYIYKGSLKEAWRLYGKTKKGKKVPPHEQYQKWTPELCEKLNNLGFVGLWGEPLNKFSGNDGLFSVFVRGHNEFLEVKN